MLRRVIAIVLLPVALTAQSPRDSIITVSASRVAKIAASSATFYVTVEGSAETAVDAVARVEAKVGAVTDAIRAYGARAVVETPVSYSVGLTPAPNGYPGVATPRTHLARTLVRVRRCRYGCTGPDHRLGGCRRRCGVVDDDVRSRGGRFRAPCTNRRGDFRGATGCRDGGDVSRRTARRVR